MTASPTRRTRAAAVATVPGTNITASWEDIGPEQAEQYLGVNTHNRKVSLPLTNRLANDMAAGRYRITHQGVAFDEHGVLLDGQHRLLAIVASDTTQTLLVTRGLPPEAQILMDGGRKRNAADFLGGSYTAMRASAARIVYACRQVGPNVAASTLYARMGFVTTSELLEESDPTDLALITTLANMAGQAARPLVTMGPSPLLAAAVLVIRNEEAARDFLDGFVTLADMPSGDPRIALMKVRGTVGKRFNGAQAFSLAARTAIAHMEGREVRMLRVLPPNAVFMTLD